MKSATKLAKELDFENEEEYFSYIIESDINGNCRQVKTLFEDMNNESKKDFMKYLTSSAKEVFSQDSIDSTLRHIY